MTAKTPAQLKAEAATSFPDNTVGAITPAIMRTFQGDIIDSFSAGQTFDVTQYGATGNGVTDDTSAITAAIAAIPATGGVLYFPAGNYLTSGGFTIANATTIKGDGEASVDQTQYVTQIICSSATAVLFTVTAKIAHFRHMALKCTAATPTAGSAIFTNGAFVDQYVTYNHLTVHDFYDCIDVGVGGAGWMMSECSIYNPVRYGLRIRNTINADEGDWIVSGCFFDCQTKASTAGIYIESSGGGKIIDNKFNGIPGSGFGFVNSIVLNTASSSGQLMITANDMESMSSAAINIAAGWPYISIADNYIACGDIGGYTGPAITATNVQSLYIGGGIIRNTNACTYAISLTSCNTVMLGPMSVHSNFAYTINPADVNAYDSTLTGTIDQSRIPTLVNEVIGPLDPRFPGFTALALLGVNDMYVSSFQVHRAVSVSQARFVVGVQSGNIDVGIYKWVSGAGTWQKIASTGSISCPAPGLAFPNLTGAATLQPGSLYLAGFAADNTTCTIYGSASATPGNMMAGGVIGGFGEFSSHQATSFPLPATINPGALSYTNNTLVVCFN